MPRKDSSSKLPILIRLRRQACWGYTTKGESLIKFLRKQFNKDNVTRIEVEQELEGKSGNFVLSYVLPNGKDKVVFKGGRRNDFKFCDQVEERRLVFQEIKAYIDTIAPSPTATATAAATAV